jgi:phytoene/squalene synthetase
MNRKKRLNGDELHRQKELIAEAVHRLVDAMTKDLSEDDDDNLRQQLTEQFRFWKYP